jgi:hypothetical protein
LNQLLAIAALDVEHCSLCSGCFAEAPLIRA